MITRNRSILGVAFAVAALSPLAALADGFRHFHDADCHHGAMPAGQPTSQGRYELQSVQKMVADGYFEQVWVPGECDYRGRRHGHPMRCSGGYYDRRWHPARYEPVQEWVWVAQGNYPDDGYARAEVGWSAWPDHASASVSFR